MDFSKYIERRQRNVAEDRSGGVLAAGSSGDVLVATMRRCARPHC